MTMIKTTDMKLKNYRASIILNAILLICRGKGHFGSMFRLVNYTVKMGQSWSRGGDNQVQQCRHCTSEVIFALNFF